MTPPQAEQKLDALSSAREERVSEAIKSTASNMVELHAEVKAASQAITQTVGTVINQQIGRGHARVLHDFGPAAYAGTRGGGAATAAAGGGGDMSDGGHSSAGEIETAERMVRTLH
jgi:hypothetical protein